MEWLTAIRKSIEYVEEHILEDISVQDVGDSVGVSSIFLQKGFSVMTGYSISEYIRNRRLYMAAVDLASTDEKIIDIAFNYCYETPESFTKAFTRFHGSTPSQIRQKSACIRTFLPLKINISITGGYNMEYKIVNMKEFKVIGFERSFSFEEAMEKIPPFWGEVFERYVKNVVVGNSPSNDIERAIVNNSIGEFGICVDDTNNKCLSYIIGGRYNGGAVPEGMKLVDLPLGDYAVFDCYGPMPDSLQSLSKKIFNEWLPGNPNYEINGNASIEWYDGSNKNNQDPKYHSQVWIPVKIKN